MRSARRNEGLETGWRPLDFVDDAHALRFQLRRLLFAVGYIERQMMHPLAAPFEKLVDERILAERLQQLDGEPVQVELSQLEAGRIVSRFVHEARAESILEEPARLGDALNRDTDMIEFADWSISHRHLLPLIDVMSNMIE